ncbi:MAG TPA: alcohol dehydrogenase catalytic domain-containing protein [Gaiellaceae bacterium]|jgi:S-(hydroxymethyl)mycothiol dehydrogenase|nr:alcohol dehydrogenase catalytic domain-containing protein [Gaiellaceae bacterium]
MDRGVVLSELDRFAVEEISLDEPGPGEATVRIEATGVCHSDLHVVRTGHNHPLPVLLGHEGAGVVEAVGEGVEHVSPGDRVIVGWRSPCGECRWCSRGAEHLCRTPPVAAGRMHTSDGRDLFGVFRAGTFATRSVLHGASLVPLPVELPAEQACLIGCAVATGVCSVLKTAEVWEGARVGVIGCGAVGLSVIQGAIVAGAAEVHALDLDDRKLEAARRFGATHVGPDEATRLDFVFDVVGRPETVAQGLELLGHAGTLVYIGLPQPGAVAGLPLDYAFDRRLRILVSHGGDHVPAEDFPLLAQLADAGGLDLAGMVTKRIALDDVVQAFDDMEAGAVIRSVIVP